MQSELLVVDVPTRHVDGAGDALLADFYASENVLLDLQNCRRIDDPHPITCLRQMERGDRLESKGKRSQQCIAEYDPETDQVIFVN